MRYGVLDVESTIFAKGQPFADRNKLCVVGLRIVDSKEGTKNHIFRIEHGDYPYSEALSELGLLICTCPTIVGFNLKFDLNWLARYGITLPSHIRVFDCQLAEFIIDFQRTPYPSLNGCLSKYNLGSKSSVVELEYWSKGIDTDQIPWEVLVEYNGTDLEKTDQLYQVLQQKLIEGGFGPLSSLHFQDLRVLQEMEFNGLTMDWTQLELQARAAEEEIKEIDGIVLGFVPADFRAWFNAASGDHISALLYGGSVSVDVGEPYAHTYKGGAKAGTTETRYKWRVVSCTFPQLFKPPEGSELKKKGVWSTDEETLLTIKSQRGVSGGTSTPPKVLVESLLRRSELEKLNGTYYRGIPALCANLDWKDGKIHGTFNQCRVVTGRLSSEKPNEQNFPDPLMKFIVSRFT